MLYGISNWIRETIDEYFDGGCEQRSGGDLPQSRLSEYRAPLSTPICFAAQRGEGHLIPVHDVVEMVRMILSLSPASYVRELTLPAILDERF
jgi:hypothetical protein